MKRKIFMLITFILTIILMGNNCVMASKNESTIIYEENYEISITPLSKEETEKLLKQIESQDKNLKIDNEVTTRPVNLRNNKLTVEFTNRGFLLDRIDVVQTNLLIWNINQNVTGYKMTYWHLPVGSYNCLDSVYFADWYKACTMGGFYIDGFGTEIGLSTGPSGYIFNF